MLGKMLQNEMNGIQRVPALMYNDAFKSLEEVNLQNYEILPCEPLHDITGHIKNLFAELPTHLPKEEKKLFNTTVHASFDGKDCKRGCDYRASLIKLCSVLYQKVSHNVYKILTTLCEIQQILYAKEISRTSETILRLHNLTFQHACLITTYYYTKKVSKGLQSRKMFGKYYHALTTHCPQQFRIISGRSSNTEQEERTFNFLKNVSSSTSNHDPNHVIKNSIIRMQVTYNNGNEFTTKERESTEKEITKLYKSQIAKKEKSIFLFNWIEKYPFMYQAHLERIADFLSIPNIWHETDYGIMFDDLKEIPSNIKPVHHFRSFTLKKEIEVVKMAWDELVCKSPNLIPAQKIKVETETGCKIIKLKSLKYFENEAETEVMTQPDESLNKTIDFDVVQPVSSSTPLRNCNVNIKNSVLTSTSIDITPEEIVVTNMNEEHTTKETPLIKNSEVIDDIMNEELTTKETPLIKNSEVIDDIISFDQIISINSKTQK